MGNQQQTTTWEAFAHNTMMKTETIALLMAALLALSAVTHPVMAQDSDDPDDDADRDADRDDDTDEDTDETDFRDAERKLEVEHSNDEIKVESKREDNTSEDKLVVKAYAEDGKDFRLRLERRRRRLRQRRGDVGGGGRGCRRRGRRVVPRDLVDDVVLHCLGPGD